jgi:hypothetical protein
LKHLTSTDCHTIGKGETYDQTEVGSGRFPF